MILSVVAFVAVIFQGTSGGNEVSVILQVGSHLPLLLQPQLFSAV